MTATAGSPNRDVVPRWRGLNNTIVAREFSLSRPATKSLSPESIETLDRLERIWNEERSEVAAVELASGALISGSLERSDEVIDRLASAQSQRIRRFVDLLQQRRSSVELAPIIFNDVDERLSSAQARIRNLKVALDDDPRSAIAWIEIGRRYAIIGQHTQATNAVRVAAALAPTNRYILRCAASHFTTAGRPDSALILLRRAPNLLHDPWLVSAELAISEVAEVKSLSVKTARRIVESDQFAPIQITEAASELATLELRSGSNKRAKKLFGLALNDPTDNSLAQAEWASHQIPGLSLSHGSLEPPLAAEARTLDARERGDWAEAVRHAHAWLADQPLSEAASVGSYIAASTLRNWHMCEGFARAGLRSQPGDKTLTNNLTYALIEQDKLSEAERYLPQLGRDGDERAAALATAGLYYYRTGTTSRGRSLYRDAIDLAQKAGKRSEATMATLLLAREEFLSGAPDTETAIAAALDSASKTPDAVVKPWVDYLSDLWGLR